MVKQPSSLRRTHRTAFFVIAALLLAAVALLPLAIASVIVNLAQDSKTTFFIFGDHQHQDADRVMLNLNLTNLDEWGRTASINVSGHRDCPSGCNGTDRIQFIAIPVAKEDGEGLPPYAMITFGPGVRSVTEQVQLPITDHAIRYPFDSPSLEIGAVAQRSNADGNFRTLASKDAVRFLYLSMNDSIPRATMREPLPVPLDEVFSDDPTWAFAGVWHIDFARPLYLQVVALVLVVLVSLASVYAVVLAPLRDLVVSAGALILGVWGIRAIVLGAGLSGFTIIDLSLMLVILFLLVAITWRTLQYMHDRGELSLPLFRHIEKFGTETEARGEPVGGDGRTTPESSERTGGLASD
jgi:hypothetical protein